MKPYYQDADVTLYCGRWEDVLPRLEPDSVQLVVVDPPYGVAWQSRQRRIAFEPITGDDGTFDVAGLLRECSRVLQRQRHLYVFGLDDFGPLGLNGTLAGAVELVWDKGTHGSGDLTGPWAPAHERILFGVNRRSAANVAAGGGRLSGRIRRGSILRHDRPNGAGVSRHPTEKPVGLLRELIESSSLFGETVLDPCAGSGSTLVAARLEGRKAIGIEVEERYCEVAAGRLAQQQLPLEVA